ncbi:MAG TPA: nucleoside kinase, partial [Aggregatilineales bacterium]|nr:nucleoside kinase [Aggregatilineales bacterium]
TTFAKRLAIQLLAQGLRPFTLELDNYFVNREDTPKDAKGEYNFEAIEAINLPLFNAHLLAMSKGEQVRLPRFNFLTGKSEAGAIAQLSEKQVIIIEGIHGLNPRLIADLPPELVYRVYVSAITQVNIDLHNRVPTTDLRLLRRIVRDARTRGYTALDTLNRWESVRSGERVGIFAYQENADSMFDSALVYELAALRPIAEPLLLQVKPNSSAYIEAKRLLSFLGWVRPIQTDQLRQIPDTSLLREFIGDSILDDYHPMHAGE